jgi:radical SAM superfamily enzyme YgiQ (UPF0313 family)
MEGGQESNLLTKEMNVYLLNPPYRRHFIRSGRWDTDSISDSNWYPIWLAYCTGLLEKKGHRVKLLDALVEGLNFRETIEEVAKFSPQLVVIYPSLQSLDSDIEIARRIKEATKSKIIFVGPWASAAPEKMLESPAVDALAKGEFDYVVLELAQAVPLPEINGLYWRQGTRILINRPRQPVSAQELDQFPFVTDVYRRHLRIERYHQAPQLYPFVDLFTGRGCQWGRCSFCLWPYSFGGVGSYRKRHMAGVIEEFKFIRDHLPFVREVFIQDDTLPSDRAYELSESILRNGLKMTWSAYARVDLDLPTLRIMRSSGCRSLHVGYESSAQHILKLCNKGTTVEMAEEFTRNAARLGFLIHADFILGLPGETVQTIKQTINWARALPVASYQFTVPLVYPGTPLYRYLRRNGALKDGEANYPGLSQGQLKAWTRRATLASHFNLSYILRMIRRPREFMRVAPQAPRVIYNLFFSR